MLIHMQKIKIFLSLIAFFFPIYFVIAIDDEYILSPTDNSVIYFSTWSTQTKYYNKDANSDIIGNYLSWSYYSTIYGYFDFIDVRFTGSTWKCSSGYGYKLSGQAKNETVWYIDFWYNTNTFVYYCINDNKLYGNAYMQSIWEQNFDGITFEIIKSIALPNIPSKNTFFVNNSTMLFYNTPENFWSKSWEETIFYIWKQKKK